MFYLFLLDILKKKILILLGYTYWSKDIIILITDGGEAGVQAWLESYHDYPRSG